MFATLRKLEVAKLITIAIANTIIVEAKKEPGNLLLVKKLKKVKKRQYKKDLKKYLNIEE